MNTREVETNKTEVNDTEDETEISTQEMISDARARRENRVKDFQCKNCEFKSSSNTLVKRHTQKIHESNKNSEEAELEQFNVKLAQFGQSIDQNVMEAEGSLTDIVSSLRGENALSD